MCDADGDEIDLASLPTTVIGNALAALMDESAVAARYVCDMVRRLPPESFARLGELIAIERKDWAKWVETCRAIEAVAMARDIDPKH